jgi:Arc/MetJ family transcription regulator
MGMRRRRTNVVLDMDKVQRIKERYGLRTTTAAVDYAMDVVAGRPMTWEEVRAMHGARALRDDFDPTEQPPDDL